MSRFPPAGEVAQKAGLPALISREAVRDLEAELDAGASIAALRRFNDNLRKLPTDKWQQVGRGSLFLPAEP